MILAEDTFPYWLKRLLRSASEMLKLKLLTYMFMTNHLINEIMTERNNWAAKSEEEMMDNG
jgi:hypothetical protein